MRIKEGQEQRTQSTLLAKDEAGGRGESAVEALARITVGGKGRGSFCFLTKKRRHMKLRVKEAEKKRKAYGHLGTQSTSNIQPEKWGERALFKAECDVEIGEAKPCSRFRTIHHSKARKAGGVGEEEGAMTSREG